MKGNLSLAAGYFSPKTFEGGKRIIRDSNQLSRLLNNILPKTMELDPWEKRLLYMLFYSSRESVKKSLYFKMAMREKHIGDARKESPQLLF